MDILAVWINCPDARVADAVAERLVADRLAACANRYAEIVSRYRWQGRVETATEVPLLVKTRRDLFERVAAVVREVHPYETPSIVAHEFAAADAAYAAWLRAETADA